MGQASETRANNQPARLAVQARLWRAVLRWPLLAVVLIVVVQTGATLWSKDLWYPDELRHAAVLRGLLNEGHWLVLHLGDAVYPDKPPLYFWALAGLARVFGSTEPEVFLLAASLSGMAFLAAVLALGHALDLGRKVGLLAGLILLSNWFFMDRMHQPRMDLMFSALILLSHAAFFRALRPGANPDAIWAALGGATALAAVLTKGPLGAAFPVLAVAVWLGLQGRLRQLWSRPMLVGWGVLAVGCLIYLAGILAVGGVATLRLMLVDQTLDRVLGQTHNVEPFWWYLPQAAPAFLPWTLLLAALPYRRFLMVRPGGMASGKAYLACALVTGTLFLSSIGYKVIHLLLPIWGLLALGAAVALLQLTHQSRRRLFTAIAIVMAVAAGLLATLASGWTLWPDAVQGGSAVGATMLGAAALAFLARRRSAAQFAAVLCLGMSAVSLPFNMITISGLDRVMSPRAAAAILVDFSSRGYDLVEYHPYYLGHFDYHTRLKLAAVRDSEALATRIDSHACGVIALRRRDFDALPDDLRGRLQVIYTLRLDTQSYLLATWGLLRASKAASAPDDAAGQGILPDRINRDPCH